MKKIKLNTVTSTNDYSMGLLNKKEVECETVVYADSQSKGKGLGSNVWYSEDYKSLVFSLIMFPEIKVDRHFVLSMIVSLAMCDYLRFKGIPAVIKWPNDIFCQNKKLAGILIENNIVGDELKSSVIGVGLNMNLSEFPSYLPEAISMFQLSKQKYDIDKEVEIITEIITEKFSACRDSDFEYLKELYLEKLFKLNEYHNYRSDGTVFTARIIDIREDGHLVLETEDKLVREYYFKEVEFI